MSTDIKKYLALKTALTQEKARLEARLGEINQVLGQEPSSVAPASAGGRRKFSEATKAKMRAAQKARWAKVKGKGAQPTAAAPKKKRNMSAAGRAAIAAAAKARWAKVKAQKQGAKAPDAR